MATRARRLLMGVGLLVLIAALAGFGFMMRHPLPDRFGDAWLTAKIQTQFLTDADVRGTTIVVRAEEGVITLSGPVADDRERQQALAIAQTTDGVARVVDRLWLPEETVGTSGEAEKTPPPADPAITQAVQARYFTDARLKARDIGVATAEGVVTLSGTVQSDEEKAHAVATARGVEGVKDVVNEIAIETPHTPPAPVASDLPTPSADHRITLRLRDRLLDDELLQGRGIKVTTEAGVVFLIGDVRSDAERQRAIELARSIEGVADVDATGLRVVMS